MKKIITVIVIAMLAAALAIGLAACNTDGGSGGSYNPGGGYGPDSGYDPGTGDGGTDEHKISFVTRALEMAAEATPNT